jgi:surface polysaccharide O-acyltransferase-like enzyme
MRQLIGETSVRREYWLDLLRVAAAFGVVWVHVALEISVTGETPRSFDWWVGNVMSCVSRWAVPVFVMVSGALLLDPSRRESASAFYKRRARRLVVPLVFWAALFSILRITVKGDDVREVLYGAFVTGRPHSHLWYLYMVAGLVLFTPFLRTYIAASDAKERRILVWIMVCLASAGFLFATYFSEVADIAWTRFIPYMGLYLCGHELLSARAERWSLRSLVSLFILCVGLTVAGNAFLTHLFGENSKGYALRNLLSPTVIGSALSVTLIALKLYGGRETPRGVLASLVSRAAPATLGIYLVHPLIYSLLAKMGIDAQILPPLVSIPAFAIVIFLTSWAVVAVMMKVPLLRRTVS